MKLPVIVNPLELYDTLRHLREVLGDERFQQKVIVISDEDLAGVVQKSFSHEPRFAQFKDDDNDVFIFKSATRVWKSDAVDPEFRSIIFANSSIPKNNKRMIAECGVLPVPLTEGGTNQKAVAVRQVSKIIEERNDNFDTKPSGVVNGFFRRIELKNSASSRIAAGEVHNNVVEFDGASGVMQDGQQLIIDYRMGPVVTEPPTSSGGPSGNQEINADQSRRWCCSCFGLFKNRGERPSSDAPVEMLSTTAVAPACFVQT